MFELGNVSGYFKAGVNSIGDTFSDLGDDLKKTKVGALWDAMAGPSDEDLGRLADEESYGDVMTDEILGRMADEEAEGAIKQKWGAEAAGLGKGDEALKKVSKPYDFNKMAEVLKSVKPADEQMQSGVTSRAGGGGFRYDPSQYENPLIAREYRDLYMAPLYKNLI